MKIIVWGLLFFHLYSCTQVSPKRKNMKSSYKVTKTEEEWKKELSPQAYHVLRKKGTELPFSGKYNLFFKDGTYRCAACDAPLFRSESKFESHCGWPSFDQAIKGSVLYKKDQSHGIIRTEILCAKCGGHLGHVFNDGTTETEKRYCINSVSLSFKEKK